MKSAFSSLLGVLMMVSLPGAASAQSVLPPVLPSSAPVPMSAASTPMPLRSPAVKAAENANEPGKLRPEQRVIPQITVPLKGSNSPSPAAPSASLNVGSVPGAVNDGAARCLATSGPKEMAACERGFPASGPLKMGR